MNTGIGRRVALGPVVVSLLLAFLGPAQARADEQDPPTRAARLAYLQGSVSFQPGGTTDWVAPPINRPLTTGDQLWADRDGRAELQLDGSLVRLSSNTAMSFLNLSDHVTQIQLSAGTLVVHVRRLDDTETYEIDTPNLAFSVLRPGVYRLTVDEAGNSTTIAVRSGQGEATGGGAAYRVLANENDVFTGNDHLVENPQDYGPQQDAFDAWSAARDSRWDRSASARYVSADVVGYEDLDEHGSWTATAEFGHVWFPRGVRADWAPYHDGHWAYIAPWGYTWVDDSPWGFAPFHYGRWAYVQGAWGWVPTPPVVEGEVYVRPVYAPALVAWVGVGVGVAWFALGPREVYVPSYPVSRNYVTNINVTNTTVNTTVVNNVYNNTTIVNNNNVTNVTNVKYVNRTIPGAVVATSSQAFTSGQPVARNVVRVDQRAVVSAPVRVTAPPVVPTKQAVIGAARPAVAAPPARVQTRPVVVRTAPPPPPPSFERHQAALQSNGGKPLSVVQVHQLAASTAPRPVPVKIAPPATMAPPRASAATAKETPAGRSPTETSPPPAARPPVETQPPINRPTAPVAGPAPSVRPPAASPETSRPPAAAVHPNELPPAVRPPSASTANSVLERQHLQEQQQLHAQQEAERQRLQQQHELEHQRIATEQADKARQQELERQQLQKEQADKARLQQIEQQRLAREQADRTRQLQIEQQHAQQTQQLAQQHAQQQQQMQTKQQEQRRQFESPPPARPAPAAPPPKSRKDEVNPHP